MTDFFIDRQTGIGGSDVAAVFSMTDGHNGEFLANQEIIFTETKKSAK